MTIAVGTRHTRKWEFVKGHYLAAALGAAVLMGTLVGVGAWQAIGTGTAEKTALPTWAVQVPRNVDPTLTYYIVADEAQAQKVRWEVDEAAYIRAAGGDFEQADDIYVLVANDASELARTQLGLLDLNRIRVDQGLSEIQDAFPDVAIGSYPKSVDGRYATDLVIRSRDEARLEAAAKAVGELVARVAAAGGR